MENVSRETIKILTRLEIAAIVVQCDDCLFPSDVETALREDWTLVLEHDLVRCPFCRDLRRRGANAPIALCLSSITNLNGVVETDDTETVSF